MLDGNRRQPGAAQEGLILYRESLPSCAIVEDNHPNQAIVILQRLREDGSRPGVLHKCGMCVGRSLVIVDTQSLPALGHRPGNRFTGLETYPAHPFPIAVPGLRNKELLCLVPEQDRPRDRCVYQLYRAPGDKSNRVVRSSSRVISAVTVLTASNCCRRVARMSSTGVSTLCDISLPTGGCARTEACSAHGVQLSFGALAG